MLKNDHFSGEFGRKHELRAYQLDNYEMLYNNLPTRQTDTTLLLREKACKMKINYIKPSLVKQKL